MVGEGDHRARQQQIGVSNNLQTSPNKSLKGNTLFINKHQAEHNPALTVQEKPVNTIFLVTIIHTTYNETNQNP